jgi:hypothetical protein
MRLIPVSLAVLLLTACAAAEPSCSVGVADPKAGIGLAVSSCSSIGSYSVGGLYGDAWDRLTFQYPEPWKGTFATFNLDGEYYCTSDDPKNCTLMDAYSTRRPAASAAGIEARWSLPSAAVGQSFRLVQNRTIVKYSVANTGQGNLTAGVRIHIDTMLGVNDGAPIYIPGDGLRTREVSYSGDALNFGYWKAYNRPDEPTIVSTGTIDPKAGMTYPYKVVVADWKRSKDTAWDYVPEGRPITGDSAVLIYYDLGVIAPGQEKAVEMGYGSEAPVLSSTQGQVGVAEITLGSISGEYCPGEEASFKVDVLSAGQDRSGSVRLTVELGGEAVYESSASSAFPKDQVKTIEFMWKIPSNATAGAYGVKASLYNATGLVDSKDKPGAVTVSPDRCGLPVVAVGTTILGGMLLVILALAGGLAATLGWYVWSNRGSVDFRKYVEGENVTVNVTNNTQKTLKEVVIEDRIPAETEIRVHTLNALRRRSTLIWEVGRLRPKESATLEYWVRGGYAVNGSKLTWDRGSKALGNVQDNA